MNIQSPAQWADNQAEHWNSMPEKLRNVIAFCAVELMALGMLALYTGG
ncbi:MAG TPA: hypothetical protein VEK34_16725 [Methylocella sp.]|nr:hypothetical protein [Methylocella sp.]